MATIIVCDGGCGAQSPNPFTRLHEANRWLRVRVGVNHRFDRSREHDDKLFCKECEPRVMSALTGETGGAL